VEAVACGAIADARQQRAEARAEGIFIGDWGNFAVQTQSLTAAGRWRGDYFWGEWLGALESVTTCAQLWRETKCAETFHVNRAHFSREARSFQPSAIHFQPKTKRTPFAPPYPPERHRALADRWKL